MPTANIPNAAGSVFGRVLIALIFLGSAANKLTNMKSTIQLMAAEGIPAPGLAIWGAIAFLLVGGLLVAIGWHTRIGASLLMIFLMLATFFFHDFWTIEDAAARGEDLIAFLKNVAIFGGLLHLYANGPGLGSVDAWFSRRRADGQRLSDTPAN